MAFQSMTKYNEENYGDKFRLADDGDYADVIFLYRSIDEVLIGDVHYLKFPEYSGYVHCLGTNCPACKCKSSRQRRIFIPMYIIDQQRVVYWDRTTNIQNQLQRDIFSRYPDPSKVVFRITRHGAYRDINTVYEITAVATNNIISYDEICTQNNIKFPEFYDSICASKSAIELNALYSGNATTSDTPVNYDLPEYQVKPRDAVGATSDIGTSLPNVSVPTVNTGNNGDIPAISTPTVAASDITSQANTEDSSTDTTPVVTASTDTAIPNAVPDTSDVPF